MPLRLALAVRATMAGHRRCALQRGGGGYLPFLPMHPGGGRADGGVLSEEPPRTSVAGLSGHRSPPPPRPCQPPTLDLGLWGGGGCGGGGGCLVNASDLPPRMLKGADICPYVACACACARPSTATSQMECRGDTDAVAGRPMALSQVNGCHVLDAPPPSVGGAGAADTQPAHHATSSTAPAHQLLGSANAETTPARAPAAAADRK